MTGEDRTPIEPGLTALKSDRESQFATLLSEEPAPFVAPTPAEVVRQPKFSAASWPLADRIGYWLCWATGVGLCLITLGIVGLMFVKGISYLRVEQFLKSPAPSLQQSQSGGFLDPLVGTFVITAIGILIAAPIGVALATWLSEYARPSWLARATESAIEIISGAPSVVLAIFGLLIFSQGFLSFLSQPAAQGSLGSSFLCAGIVMALLAMPLIVGSTRQGLTQVPDRMREASFALGHTRARTIWRVLLPSIRPSIASGVVLGIGRIIGDTAIVIFLAGGSLINEPNGNVPILGLLRGTGSTLTSYVYEDSPAGEGNAHQKAYAAAFVLLVIVLALNAVVTRLTGPEREKRRRFSLRLKELAWIR